METITYDHPQGGYEISVPKNWEKKLENTVSVGFVGTEPSTAFNVIYEIGGFDYYSLDKLAEEMILSLGNKIDNLQIISRSENGASDSIYQFVAQGMLPGEQEIRLKGFIIAPDPGIRYYLLFTAGIKDFDSLDALFNDIAGSFKINKSSNELYQQLIGREEEKTEQEK
ncbi:MAG: hypothetical protein AAGU27_19010 [Dehalobacterium sp.]